ncbi:hypothetical protein HK096_003000 [Nowakowskiella sp. JEL0078]|nr:hypothetical protein HK096_003000 [Nowakowskiella sp. JEL0078]
MSRPRRSRKPLPQIPLENTMCIDSLTDHFQKTLETYDLNKVQLEQFNRTSGYCKKYGNTDESRRQKQTKKDKYKHIDIAPELTEALAKLKMEYDKLESDHVKDIHSDSTTFDHDYFSQIDSLDDVTIHDETQNSKFYDLQSFYDSKKLIAKPAISQFSEYKKPVKSADSGFVTSAIGSPSNITGESWIESETLSSNFENISSALTINSTRSLNKNLPVLKSELVNEKKIELLSDETSSGSFSSTMSQSTAFLGKFVHRIRRSSSLSTPNVSVIIDRLAVRKASENSIKRHKAYERLRELTRTKTDGSTGKILPCEDDKEGLLEFAAELQKEVDEIEEYGGGNSGYAMISKLCARIKLTKEIISLLPQK